MSRAISAEGPYAVALTYGPRCRSEGLHREKCPAFRDLSALRVDPKTQTGPGAEAPGPAAVPDGYDSG